MLGVQVHTTIVLDHLFLSGPPHTICLFHVTLFSCSYLECRLEQLVCLLSEWVRRSWWVWEQVENWMLLERCQLLPGPTVWSKQLSFALVLWDGMCTVQCRQPSECLVWWSVYLLSASVSPVNPLVFEFHCPKHCMQVDLHVFFLRSCKKHSAWDYLLTILKYVVFSSARVHHTVNTSTKVLNLLNSSLLAPSLVSAVFVLLSLRLWLP